MEWVVPALKIGALGAGVVSPYLGAALMLLDGRFHMLSSQATLERESPDWIILRHFAGRPGFSAAVHRGIAALVIGTTLLWLGLQARRHLLDREWTPWMTRYHHFYRRLFMPVTLGIIALAILLKNIVLRQRGGVAFITGTRP